MDRREFMALTPAFPAATVAASLTLRAEGQEPIEVGVSVLKLQPGDTLVIQCSGPISMNAAENIKSMVEAEFKGVRALVLDGDLKLEGVLRWPA